MYHYAEGGDHQVIFAMRSHNWALEGRLYSSLLVMGALLGTRTGVALILTSHLRACHCLYILAVLC